MKRKRPGTVAMLLFYRTSLLLSFCMHEKSTLAKDALFGKKIMNYRCAFRRISLPKFSRYHNITFPYGIYC